MPIKAEELKSFTDYLDINLDEVESIDQLKQKFEENFGRKELIKAELAKDESFIAPIIGKRFGSLDTKIRQYAKDDLGLEFDAGELKDKKVEEVLDLTIKKAKTKFESEIAELKKNIVSDPSELTKEWEQKVKILQSENENWKSQAEKANQEFETFKNTLAQRQREEKLNHSLESAFKSVKFAPEVSELTIEGFKSKILGEVKFDFDEKENFSIFDKEGKTIFRPNKNGVPYTPEDYIKDKALEHKILQVNGGGGNPPAPPIKTGVDSNPPPKFVHPNALV